MIEPTQLDIDNAATRRAIADREQAEYDRVRLLALRAYGSYYTPHCKHMLHEKVHGDHLRHQVSEPARTVYTCRRDSDGAEVFFYIDQAGEVVKAASMEKAFGPMLLEPHPTYRMMHNGVEFTPHRYNLCWGCFPLSSPKSAQELAEARAVRQRNKAEKAAQRDRERNPLFQGLTDDES